MTNKFTKFKKRIALLTVLCMIITLSMPVGAGATEQADIGGDGGSGLDSGFNQVIAVEEIIITSPDTVIVGDALQMTATIVPENAKNTKITWSVINGTGKATIDKAGLLTSLELGTITVTAKNKASKVTGTKVITITAPVVAVTGVSLDTSTASIFIGATQTLLATASPADATDKSVTWSTDNAAVATVNNAGVVTGVSAGTALITVTTVDGNFSATCAVTVTADPALVMAAIEAINTAPNGPALVSAILSNASLLGLNLTEFNLLSDADKIIAVTTDFPGDSYVSPMLSIYFTSITLIQTELDGAVAYRNQTLTAQATALEAINTATIATMESVIAANATIFGILPLTSIASPVLTAAGKANVIEAMTGKSFITINDVKIAYNGIATTQQVNSLTATTSPTMKNFILGMGPVPNYSKLGISANVWNSVYYMYPTTGTVGALRDSIPAALVGKNFASANEVKVAFENAVNAVLTQNNVVTIINAATGGTTVGYYFSSTTIYASALGLDLTAYNALGNKFTVQTAVANLTAATAAQIKETFDFAVAVQEINEATVDTMNTVLVRNAAILGLNLTDYNTLIDKTPVHTALLTPVFNTTTTLVATAFNAAVQAQKNIETPAVQ